MSTLIELTGGLVYLEIILFALLFVTVILEFVMLKGFYNRHQYKQMWHCSFVLAISIADAAFIAGRIFGQLSMIS